MNNDTIEALKEAIPAINEFRINPVGGDNITVEGNQWFCHSHEVKAYKDAVKALITQLEAEAVKPVDIEAGAKALAMEYWRECYDAEMGEVLDWETPELYAEDNWRIYKRQTRAIAQSFGLRIGGEGER